MRDINVPELLADATDAVQAAGRALVEALAGRPRRPEFQSWAQFRAEFDGLDGMSTALIRDRLASALPEADWAAELGTELPSHGEVWVLDALDGAIQYIQGLPNWSVSLALVSEGEVALAVLHNPLRSETYTGLRGGGAYLDGTPVTPSVKTDLSITLVSTSQHAVCRRSAGGGSSDGPGERQAAAQDRGPAQPRSHLLANR